MNGLLLSTAVASANEHPKVQAVANTVDIENRGADYYGPLFIGQDYRENRVVYDTMSDWTVVIGDDTKGAAMPGNYDVF